MSKINRIRIMNLNYNRNTIRIDDETFDMNGDTTLLSLRNGGGKTVLVQMIMSLFVNKSYRDLGERAFSSYFTTNQPTFIMVEWKLDHGAGFFLTGMMVRKNQDAEQVEPLEIINFTSEYKDAVPYNMDELPILIESNGKKMLKGFSNCKKEFDVLRSSNGNQFSYYDMTIPYQRKNYFSKLAEFQIEHKEWETIIHKVNSKESGLSELFSEAKDENGLIEKWMLYSIQNKLNQSGNRIKNFQNLAYKLIEQYRKNQTSINRREIIKQYFEDIIPFEEEICRYEEITENHKKIIDEIGNFIFSVKIVLEELKKDKEQKNQNICQFKVAINDIMHEKFSYRIYDLDEKRLDTINNRIESEMCISTEKKNIYYYSKELCIQECAKLYEECMDFNKSITDYNEKKDMLLEKEKDSSNESEMLASKLFTYYKNNYELSNIELENIKSEIEKYNNEENANKKQKEDAIHSKEKIALEIGAKNHEIKVYDEMEEDFGTRYKEKLIRNILGEYEEGTIAILKKKFEKEQTDNSVDIKSTAQKIGDYESCLKKLNDKNIELEIIKNNLQNDNVNAQKDMEKLKEEKVERINILKSIDLDEKYIDDNVEISRRLQGKVDNLKAKSKELTRELQEKQESHENLKQGKLVELPENIRSLFEENNIKIIYGMEWLRKNGREYDYNQKLVEFNPFIPYSLILEKNDILKLKNINGEAFTSFPIPILQRQQLESGLLDNQSGVVEFEKIMFYVMFNKHLLNPTELAKMLTDLEHQIEQLREKICLKDNEANEFNDKKFIVERQEYTTKRLDECVEKINEINSKIGENKEEIYKNKLEIEEYNQKLKNNKIILDDLKNRHEMLIDKLDRFNKLSNAYDTYLQNRETLSLLEKKQKDINEQIIDLEQNIKDIIDKRNTTNGNLYNVRKNKDDLYDKYQYYKNYSNKDMEISNQDKENITKYESRFDNIINGIGKNLREIEASLKKEQERLRDKEKELVKKNKFSIQENEYKNVKYLDEQVEYFEKKKRDSEELYNEAMESNTKLEKEITNLETSIKYERENMIDKTGYLELVEKNKIIDTEFDARIKSVEFDKNIVERELSVVNKKIEQFQRIDSAMADYSDFSASENVISVEEIKKLTNDELNEKQGKLRKYYRLGIDNINNKQKKIKDIIQELNSKECYKDEYFKKCFSNLLSLVEDVEQLRKQSDTNKYSFDTLRRKLESDLASIDRDKNNIAEFFREYVKDIDDNMRLIDKNSTISIRDRNVKMLKIVVPDWKENEEIYKIRINDFVEQFIRLGMDALDKNENVEETLGKFITTKNLYNDVVGIGNIAVKLYKIEAEREVPITWAEVSANSGGEGFLSAFTILSCLLSFMRRNETDLFSNGEESKVLIMDNPFAQTYSEHLLKPMMEIAKKTNTQLICLSGIGGDAIYNRFDNIYVINLKKSGIYEGREYVKVEHKRGNDIKKMRLSQFRAEQISLFEVE